MKTIIAAVAILAATLSLAFSLSAEDARPLAQREQRLGVVKCANLVYANNKSSVCFSDQFLAQAAKDTNTKTTGKFTAIRADEVELYEYPFAVMTGEGAFVLTAAQRDNLKNYLTRGGFLLASAGCSSPEWAASFNREIKTIFPTLEMKKLEMSHELFRTVYEIKELTAKRNSTPHLSGLEIDGKIVVVFTEDGLNDTANAGPNCCCCGGNEIRNAKLINVNLLAYALTH